MRNYKEEYEAHRRTAQGIVETADDPLNHILYLTFTKYGKLVIERENKRFLDDVELDHTLGIMNDKEFNDAKVIYAIIEKSIANGTVY